MNKSESSSEEEYIIEKIVNFGYQNGKLYYACKWAGHDDPNDLTWEPYTTLQQCQDLINEFFNRINIPKPPDELPKNNNNH